jgi:hypothetical protein
MKIFNKLVYVFTNLYNKYYLTNYNVFGGKYLLVIELRAWKAYPPNRNAEMTLMRKICESQE